MTSDEGMLARARKIAGAEKPGSQWVDDAAVKFIAAANEFRQAEAAANRSFDTAMTAIRGKRFTPEQARELTFAIEVATRA